MGNDRTAYVIGLLGGGRRYINELLLENIGERANYFRDVIRFHSRPTSMIYSGHATKMHVSSHHYPPDVTSHIFEAVRLGIADLIFVYRHPLDSLLTNWTWCRTHSRDNGIMDGISAAYEDPVDICADLGRNFLEFEAFAEGDPDVFPTEPGPRFLSFPEFVEETEFYSERAPLTLRLEDLMIDPFKEFCKIVDAMSADLDLDRLPVAPPKPTPYGYLAVKERVPRFRDFINGLDALTKRRLEKIGYGVL